MSKKKKREVDNAAADMLAAFFSGGQLDFAKIAELEQMVDEHLTDEEKTKMEAINTLIEMGVTPDEYSEYYMLGEMATRAASRLVEANDDEDGSMINPFPFARPGFGRKSADIKEYEPLKDASQRTLVLKIQMKDVVKPPMWREVEVPADYNFEQLHSVIQIVMGLADAHLWQFNKSAYDPSLTIGIEMDHDDPSSFGVEGTTHEAAETPLTQFLQEKGDKLEYVYDFGDDWIFTVTVKALLDKKIEHPVCLKYKSELNAIEDFGGIWSYVDAREQMAAWESLSKKERKRVAEEHGFDDADYFYEVLEENIIDLDFVNSQLREL